eukprot:COSAG01_NODE_1067_length_11878_cov_89.529077_13_plen_119_part_00
MRLGQTAFLLGSHRLSQGRALLHGHGLEAAMGGGGAAVAAGEPHMAAPRASATIAPPNDTATAPLRAVCTAGEAGDDADERLARARGRVVVRPHCEPGDALLFGALLSLLHSGRGAVS